LNLVQSYPKTQERFSGSNQAFVIGNDYTTLSKLQLGFDIAGLSGD